MSNPFISNSVKQSLKKLAEKSELSLYKSILDTPRKQIIIGNVPSKSNCYRIVTFKSKDPLKKGYSTLAKTPELKQYEKNFTVQCSGYRNAGINTDFNFEMDVYYPSRRSDLDNSLKCVLDCLQTVGAITNDNLCVQIICRRSIDKNNPRIEFVITPINS